MPRSRTEPQTTPAGDGTGSVGPTGDVPGPPPAFSPALLDVLWCPLCHGGLGPAGRSLRCAGRHTFDIARQGYVSLLTGKQAPSADTAGMVEARAGFLAAGHYTRAARWLAGAVAPLCPADGVVLDAGTGTGHYLAAVLDAVPGAVGLGVDASKYAVRRAARAHPRAAAAVADVWQPLPVRTGSVYLLLNVFAPRHPAEFRRVLRPGGVLAVVTPTPRHLAEAREAMGLLEVDPAKEARLERAFSSAFRPDGPHTAAECEYPVSLSAAQLEQLVLMGPTAHHRSPEEVRDRVARMRTPLTVTVSFRLSVHRPR